MGNTLTLARHLRSMPEQDLVDALVARDLGLSLTAIAGIRDYFDLADVLLEHGAVQKALTRLDRHTLTALAVLAREKRPLTPEQAAEKLAPLAARPPHASAIGERLDAAASLLLVHPHGEAFACYDAICDQLRGWPTFGLPGLEELAGTDAGGALERVPDVDRRFIDKLAAERAFAATGAVTELLLELERQPARELAKGGIALPDAKRLAAAMRVDLETVTDYLTLAERGAFVRRDSTGWMTTETGNDWLGHPTSTRWRLLTDVWFARLPGDIRALLAERAHSLWGDGLRSYIDWLYPAGGEWMDERVTSYTRGAELLGITAAQAPSGPGAMLLAGRPDEAEELLRPLLPREVSTVYLQHDLSVVAPGPLEPAIDERMRVVADVENRGLATTYRISAATVNRALTAGETAESLREFLGEISSTGIPQPLDYLITEGAARYGLLRVGTLDGEALDPDDPSYGARSYVRSDDAHLLQTVAVDQSLASIALTRVGEHRLVSRFDHDIVFWSLSDARYPVAAEDEHGAVLALRRHRIAREQRHHLSDPLVEMVTRLASDAAEERAADGDDTSQAWLARQVESAARAKETLVVSVRMPGGDVVDYELEPTSVSGGRMRARDKKSDIERTLPLSSVTAVRTWVE
ncbi:MAG: helicase-associated domain-containing protein [Salinibacterium sp.]|nr:helicase-associated domain-containing protein [Salinibacterium sp.]MBF0671927.1 helicase-associated domain-containing protein [Salinibacterium sp.]